MRALPIHVRLTAWYFVILTVSFSVFGLLAFEEMRRSILSAVDSELQNRAEEFQTSLNREAAHASTDYIQAELTQHAQGDMIRLVDLKGNWVYRSPVIQQIESSLPAMGSLAERQQFLTVKRENRTLRVLTTNVSIADQSFRMQLADQMRDHENAINRFGLVMLFSLPLVLVAASAGGYWMSSRALEPVDRITNAALAITARNLSSRLDVPPANDELRRLTETLNAMLGRLEDAFKRITQFTADASHELRTPLALMRATAEYVLRRPRSEAEYQTAFSSIVTDIESTTNLVDNLLFLARADDGSESMAKAQIDLVEIATEAGHKGQIIAEKKQVNFKEQICRAPIWVLGDRHSFLRLLLILIDNAVKYTPSGGRVNLLLKEQDGFAVLEIEDSGIGISDSDLPHIFERFFRAEKARTRETGGAGLGLSIGRYIAEAHGGTIGVSSAPGRGSLFSVRFPLASI